MLYNLKLLHSLCCLSKNEYWLLKFQSLINTIYTDNLCDSCKVSVDRVYILQYVPIIIG